MRISQVVFLFLAYLGSAGGKHTKPRISLFKFFSDFPDVTIWWDQAGVVVIKVTDHGGGEVLWEGCGSIVEV